MTTLKIPALWSGTAKSSGTLGTSLVQWWMRFDDALLTRLVTEALRANTSVRGAEAALQEARALRDVAAAALLPTVSASGSALRTRSSRSTENMFQAGFDASWEADIFGANRSALNASEATARATAASLGDVQVSIAAEVALSYLSLRGYQKRLEIARTNLDNQEQTLQITKWRLQAGLVTSLDAEQAAMVLEQTRAQLPVYRTSIEQSAHAIAVLTGRPPTGWSSELAASARIPQPSMDLNLNIPAETLRQRPDVRAAEQQVRAALARVAQMKAARAPNFTLGGSLGVNALTLAALTNGTSLVSAALASLSVPLLNGGALSAQVRAQQALLDQARSTYEGAVLAALTDVEDALVALGGDRERLDSLQRAAVAAVNAALFSRQLYSAGLVDFQVVLETQRSQLNTQENVATATTDVSADIVRLYKALGGGWLAEDGDAMLLNTNTARQAASR